ncbi:Uncharacterized protein ALO42_05454 [Pseudomonas syringae pv. atrofaciens]|nr:Uncharacterized protein ALO42_05454 [Pseudomonas syringae pv. atrofaciens]
MVAVFGDVLPQAGDVIDRPLGDELAETAMLLLDVQNQLRIARHALELAQMTNDARVLHQPFQVIGAHQHDFLRVEAKKHFFERWPLGVYQAVFQACAENPQGHGRQVAVGADGLQLSGCLGGGQMSFQSFGRAESIQAILVQPFVVVHRFSKEIQQAGQGFRPTLAVQVYDLTESIRRSADSAARRVQLHRGPGQTLAQGAAQVGFMTVQRALAIGTGVMAGTVGRATAGGFQQRRFAVGQAHDQHAVMQQRQQHRHQRGFLTTVQAGGGGKDAGGFTDQSAGQPQVAGAVEEVFQRRGHVAEARRAAQRQAGAVFQVIEGRVQRAAFRNLGGGRFAVGGNGRYGAQPRFHAAQFNAAGNLPGHFAGGAVAAVIEDQNVGCAHGSSSRMFSGGRPMTALSPATRIGRSMSLG